MTAHTIGSVYSSWLPLVRLIKIIQWKNKNVKICVEINQLSLSIDFLEKMKK